MKRPFRAGLVALLLFLGGFAYHRFWRAPTTEELEKLRQQRRVLNGLLEKRLADEMRLLEAGEAAVIVGVPAPLAERLAGELATQLFSDVRITLRKLEIRKEGELAGRVLMSRRAFGKYAVEVDLDEVVGVLRAGKPQLRFVDDQVGVVLPVRVAEGTGRGRLRFRWDGRGVAGVVCGDVNVSGEVVGSVVPEAYTLRGGFRLAAEGTVLVARPVFEDAEVRLKVEPSKETWDLVEKTIGEQGAVCRAALRAAGIREKLAAVMDRGFVVKLPRKLFPEVRLPVEVERSVAFQGTRIHVQVHPAGLSLTPARLWYGSEVRLSDAPEPAAEPVPEATEPSG